MQDWLDPLENLHREIDELALDAAECWTIGPFEHRLAVLQRSFGGGSLRRIALRALFERPTC